MLGFLVLYHVKNLVSITETDISHKWPIDITSLDITTHFSGVLEHVVSHWCWGVSMPRKDFIKTLNNILTCFTLELEYLNVL